MCHFLECAFVTHFVHDNILVPTYRRKQLFELNYLVLHLLDFAVRLTVLPLSQLLLVYLQWLICFLVNLVKYVAFIHEPIGQLNRVQHGLAVPALALLAPKDQDLVTLVIVSHSAVVSTKLIKLVVMGNEA